MQGRMSLPFAEIKEVIVVGTRGRARAGLRREKVSHHDGKKLNQVEQAARNRVERKVGTRFVETRHDSISGMVGFTCF
jgi:hypothetical protein